MRISYYPDTDSLYIDLSSKPSAYSREVSDEVVLDYDKDGNLAGIDIDKATVATTTPQARDIEVDARTNAESKEA